MLFIKTCPHCLHKMSWETDSTLISNKKRFALSHLVVFPPPCGARCSNGANSSTSTSPTSNVKRRKMDLPRKSLTQASLAALADHSNKHNQMSLIQRLGPHPYAFAAAAAAAGDMRRRVDPGGGHENGVETSQEEIAASDAAGHKNGVETFLKRPPPSHERSKRDGDVTTKRSAPAIEHTEHVETTTGSSRRGSSSCSCAPKSSPHGDDVANEDESGLAWSVLSQHRGSDVAHDGCRVEDQDEYDDDDGCVPFAASEAESEPFLSPMRENSGFLVDSRGKATASASAASSAVLAEKQVWTTAKKAAAAAPIQQNLRDTADNSSGVAKKTTRGASGSSTATVGTVDANLSLSRAPRATVVDTNSKQDLIVQPVTAAATADNDKPASSDVASVVLGTFFGGQDADDGELQNLANARVETLEPSLSDALFGLAYDEGIEEDIAADPNDVIGRWWAQMLLSVAFLGIAIPCLYRFVITLVESQPYQESELEMIVVEPEPEPMIVTEVSAEDDEGGWLATMAASLLKWN